MRCPAVLRFGLVAATWSLAGCSDGSNGGPATSTTARTSTAPSTTATMPAPPASSQTDLDAALIELGIDAAGAPADAVVLGDAVFCGWEDNGLGTADLDPDGQQCFLDAHLSGRAALYIQQFNTNEGDPVAWISRTDGAEVTWYIDWTRDNYGAGVWTVEHCGVIEPLDPYRADTNGQFYLCEGETAGTA